MFQNAKAAAISTVLCAALIVPGRALADPNEAMRNAGVILSTAAVGLTAAGAPLALSNFDPLGHDNTTTTTVGVSLWISALGIAAIGIPLWAAGQHRIKAAAAARRQN
jgi:hypothetical protein